MCLGELKMSNTQKKPQDEATDMEVEQSKEHNQSSKMDLNKKRTSMEKHKDIETTVDSSNSSKQGEKKSKKQLAVSLFKDPEERTFWLGFINMELFALEAGLEPITHDMPITDLITMGFLEGEAQELLTARISFPRVAQRLWPSNRGDGIEGQHANITQLPFDVDYNHYTGLSWDYHISLHFEKPKSTFTQGQITKKVLLRLQHMDIELGSDIGEPLAVLCHTSTKAWSGVVKLHLRNPEKDAIGLLKGIRVFAITLEDEILTVAKVAKSYDTIASSSLISLKIEGEELKTWEAHHLHREIVTDSFKRGTGFEITKVTKRVGDSFAWLATTSPEQLKKIVIHKIPVHGELLQPAAQPNESLTEDEIAKRNCLVLIAKNLNQVKNVEATEEAIRSHIGTELVNALYFPRAQGSTHSGVANIECANAIVYKTHLRKSARILGKYVTLHPHPKSLDGSLKPNDKTLKKLGFMDVNAALANTVETVQKAPQAQKLEVDISAMVEKEVSKGTKKLKNELTIELSNWKKEITAEAQEYTDKATEELRDSLTRLEEALGASMAAIKSIKRPALTNSATSSAKQLN